MKKYILLTLILLLAAFFRFTKLTQSPPGLNWDEVSIGYNAYSILKTGRDEWGKFLPLSFKAFGEVKLPGMIYATVPAIAIFGATDFAVRGTAAAIGVACVFAIYLLAVKLFGRPSYGLYAAFIFAVSPWGTHFSRVSFEAGLALLLTILSTYFVLLAKDKSSFYWPAMISAVLALYTYNSVRIMLPLLFIAYLLLGIIKLTKENFKTIVAVTIVGLILIIPNLRDLLSKDGQIRWGTVSITGNRGFTDDIAVSRGYLSSLPEPIPRLIQNKVTQYMFVVGNNYAQTFGSEFLFFKGSKNTQRSVQGMGLLYLFELPLLAIGISRLFRKDQDTSQLARFILPWLLLAPIPSATTLDAPSSVRALGMLPALILVESLGTVTIYHWLAKSKLALLAVSTFILWSVAYFGYLLWYVYPVKFANDWQYGYKEVMQFVNDHQDAEQIYITTKYGEPYIFTLFYTGYDPATYQQEQVLRTVDAVGWQHVFGFGKYHFSSLGGSESVRSIVAGNTGKIIIIDGFGSLPAEYKRDIVVRAPNWIDMFEGTIQSGLKE